MLGGRRATYRSSGLITVPPAARIVRINSRFSKITSPSYPPAAISELRLIARVPGKSAPNERLSKVRAVSQRACHGNGSKWFCGRTQSASPSRDTMRARAGAS